MVVGRTQKSVRYSQSANGETVRKPKSHRTAHLPIENSTQPGSPRWVFYFTTKDDRCSRL